jgi:Zn-dependent protease with chaperone function
LIVKALLFGDGLPATGEAAVLKIVGNSILVQSNSEQYRVGVDSVRLRRVGFDEAGIEFAWRSVDGNRILHVLEKESVRALASLPEFSTSQQWQALQSGHRRKSLGRFFGWNVVAGIVLLPLLLLLVFVWQADRIAAIAAARIPMTQEVELGDQAFESMAPSLNLADSGPDFIAVKTLGDKLSSGSKYRYRFHVSTTEVINAFALPGGIVVVNSGLIDATRTPEELAGVLAHEIQHVEQRHSLTAMVKELGLSGLWLLVSGDAGSTLAGSAVLQLTSLKFSRDAEEQADEKGFETLVANDIDPRGMIAFFDVMAEKATVSPPALLSTHPTSAGRKQALEAMNTALLGRNFEPLRLGAWPPR